MKNTPQTPLAFDLGGRSVRLIRGGELKLDGGAMFGIIPKPLWERTTPADDKNRITLACNCLLVESADSDRRVLVETGHGDKYDEKQRRIFGIDPAHWVKPALRDAGVEPDTISDVVLTHLHFDHAGGLTRLDGEHVATTFPKATAHVQRAELRDARANFGIMTESYRDENLTPLDDAQAWNELDGECEIVPGIHAMLTPGHTRGHQSIVIAGADRTLVYTGDVMPTAAHVGAPWNMAYDLQPLDNRASKHKLLSAAAERDWILIIDHELTTPAVTVARERDWFGLVPIR